jgi:hypothetical protein
VSGATTGAAEGAAAGAAATAVAATGAAGATPCSPKPHSGQNFGLPSYGVAHDGQVC